MSASFTGRPKTAIFCVSEKIQTAYLSHNCASWIFFDSLHLTIVERPANFEFFSQLRLQKRPGNLHRQDRPAREDG
jgi:hypothetical protein